MAQPPLSQQIHQLEEEIGTPLFTRANRRVTLTEAGKVFLADAREILARVSAAVDKARRVSRGETGWFGVGFVASAMYDVLPGVLRQFHEQFAEVELVLSEIPGVEQGQALREERIHVGFSRHQPAEAGMIIEDVTRDSLMVALPADHPIARQSAARLAELAREAFIVYPQQPESSYAEYIFELCTQEGFTPRVIQKTGEIQTAVSLVDAGIGITIVPASAAMNLRRKGVCYVPIAEPTPSVILSMSYRKDDASPILPHFLRIVRNAIKKE
jgi:DNA-binding transcriptional LysR family regulator